MNASGTIHPLKRLGIFGVLMACAGQSVVTSPGTTATSSEISVADLRSRLYLYADDSMMGREAGTPGNAKATAYLAAEAKRLGLEPAGENGTYFQEIKATSTRFPGSAAPGTARNVIAIIRGSDPVLRNEYVSIGAHNDHVGVRGTAVDHDSLRAFNAELARLGGRWDRTIPAERRAAIRASVRVNMDSLRKIRPGRRDSISNGADDDGSGTVALLEIAEAIAASPVKPKRSILFVWHTAEEKGLLGAKWFTENPTVPRSSIVAQLNMDMVGRGGAADIAGGGPDYLQLVGSRRVSTELGDLVEQINSASPRPFKFDYTFDQNGHPERIYCRSDHYMYARYGIPVTFFTTGLHPDYHQVTDEPQYVDYDRLQRVASFVHGIAIQVANLDHRLRVDKPVGDPSAACVQ
ncbi:MAG TPA: M20/M25/M40 family metallo-hydrolase [Gemmatimonadaceae bacterium]|nr:M20/M25/M40 family metallo-hydrolase [Gemmatimonadaceae bacterium]